MQDCTDFPDWHDSDGDTCSDYVTYKYCTSTGGIGIGLTRVGASFEDYRNMGHIATTACCGCGKGRAEIISVTVLHVLP